MQIDYKHYILQASSYQLAETKKWKARIDIINPEDENGRIPMHPFTDHTKSFETKEEADAYAFAFGKELVDKNCPTIKPPV